MYTTAPPPAMAAATQAALEMVQTDPSRRARLWDNREQLFQGLQALGFKLTNTESPILPIILNDPQLAMQMSRKLLERGIYIPAIRPPTVPKGTSRLRVTVTSEHLPNQLEVALEALKAVGEELAIF